MPKYVLSSAAETDIEGILAWTEEHFGESARLRYEALLVQAIIDVGSDPHRAGCQARPEIARSASTYHLFFSRNNVHSAVGRVKRPRHFLLFRMADQGCVEIARVLHDSMELARHLPPDME